MARISINLKPDSSGSPTKFGSLRQEPPSFKDKQINLNTEGYKFNLRIGNSLKLIFCLKKKHFILHLINPVVFFVKSFLSRCLYNWVIFFFFKEERL